MKDYYVYILTNKTNTVFYVGVTSNLVKRIFEHKSDFVDGFTKKYRVHKLVYFEVLSDPENAIIREKKLKRWRKDWKHKLICNDNPGYLNLYQSIIGCEIPDQVRDDGLGGVVDEIPDKVRDDKRVDGSSDILDGFDKLTRPRIRDDGLGGVVDEIPDKVRHDERVVM